MKVEMDAGRMAEEAVANARAGCSCSEAVALAFAGFLGLDRGLAMGMAAGLAGGMGLCGETCGVVAAGMVVLGVRHGPASVDQGFKRQRAMLLAAEFADRFRLAHGSTLCRELCAGADLRSPEGARALRESGAPERLVAGGAAILAGLLAEEEGEGS